MGTEDFIALPASGDAGNENENNKFLNCNETREACSQSSVLKCKDNDVSIEKVALADDVQFEDMRCIPQSDLNDETQPCGSDMEIEDLNNLPDFSKSRSRSENNEILGEAEYLPVNSADKNMQPSGEPLQQNGLHMGYVDVCHVASKSFEKELVDNSSFSKTGDQLTVTNTVSIEFNGFNSGVPIENGSATSHHGNPIKNHKSDAISGVKRPRTAMDEQQPSVHVVYSSLTRASKQKLDELLKQWSEWHAQRGSLSQDDKEFENLESGEETFFPALCVGTKKKNSAVTFWIDNQRIEQQKIFIPLDDNSVPLYDRGFTLGLTSANDSSNVEGGQKVIGDASRCFNCGSYNHSLKDCPKPRDNAAVNNARKEYKSKRHHNSGSRNSTRYYQNSQGGKYDDLRPGALDAETRKLLGLKELDPPPWLNRMRELGYPPGYLDPDDEDQPSGITIYADEEPNEQEDGEITEVEYHEPQRKMSVEFPGINAPIPENADERLWAAEPSSSSGLPRNRSHQRLNHYADYDGRGNDHHYQRWSRDYRDDRPPGVDSVYASRYGGYDFSYDSQSPRGNFSMSRSPNLGRLHSDRGRRSPLIDDDYSRYGPYSSPLFSPPRRR